MIKLIILCAIVSWCIFSYINLYRKAQTKISTRFHGYILRQKGTKNKSIINEMLQKESCSSVRKEAKGDNNILIECFCYISIFVCRGIIFFISPFLLAIEYVTSKQKAY